MFADDDPLEFIRAVVKEKCGGGILNFLNDNLYDRSFCNDVCDAQAMLSEVEKTITEILGDTNDDVSMMTIQDMYDFVINTTHSLKELLPDIQDVLYEIRAQQ